MQHHDSPGSCNEKEIAQLLNLVKETADATDRELHIAAIRQAFIIGYQTGQRKTIEKANAQKAKQRKKRHLNPAIKDYAAVVAVVIFGSYIWIRIFLGIIGIR